MTELADYQTLDRWTGAAARFQLGAGRPIGDAHPELTAVAAPAG